MFEPEDWSKQVGEVKGERKKGERKKWDREGKKGLSDVEGKTKTPISFATSPDRERYLLVQRE